MAEFTSNFFEFDSCFRHSLVRYIDCCTSSVGCLCVRDQKDSLFYRVNEETLHIEDYTCYFDE